VSSSQLEAELSRIAAVQQEQVRNADYSWTAEPGEKPGFIRSGLSDHVAVFDADGNIDQEDGFTVRSFRTDVGNVVNDRARSEAASQQSLASEREAKSARDIATVNAALAVYNAASSFASTAQAVAAALVSGAPLYTTLPNPLPPPLPDGRRVFQLQTPAGVQAYSHDGTTAKFEGWVGRIGFDAVAQLLAYDVAFGPAGTVLNAGGYEYRVAPVAAMDHHLVTAGGVKLYVLSRSLAAWGLPAAGDVSALIQKFFDHAFALKGEFDWNGRHQISAALAARTSETGPFFTGKLHLDVAAPISGHVLRLQGSFGRYGDLVIQGPTTYSARRFDDGIIIDGGGRTNVGRTRVYGAKRWAVIYGRGANSNMASFDAIYADSCGSSGGKNAGRNINVTGGVNTGTSNSFGQRTVFSTAEDLTGVVPNLDFLYINGDPHVITAVGAGALEVFPWTTATEGSFGLIAGGGLCTLGGDGGQVQVGLIDARNSGIAFRPASLYGCQIDRLSSQTGALCVVFGNGISNGHNGTNIDFMYHESNWRDIVTMSTAVENCTIGGIAEFRRLKVAYVDRKIDAGEPLSSFLVGVAIASGDGVFTRSPMGINRLSTTQGVSNGRPDKGRYTYNTGSTGLIIVPAFNAMEANIFNRRDWEAVVYGNSPNGGPTVAVIVRPAADHTINGQAAGVDLVFPANPTSGPIRIAGFAVTESAWRVGRA
jgi:hypothetical protein